jgi:hypothetical protein
MTKQLGVFVLLFLLICVGCLHHPIETASRYSLEKSSEYPLLVPSIPPTIISGDFQTVQISLPVKDGRRVSTSNQCSIRGAVFSLTQDASSNSDQWLITSPSVQGWEKHGGEIDLTTEWNNFTHAIELRKELGCFPEEASLSSITRVIIEKISLPASESLLFFYSFSGSRGFVDLSPGMQIKVERILVEGGDEEQTAKRKPTSLEAQYDVIPLSATGVTLHLSKTSAPKSDRSFNAKDRLVFDLSTHFATEPLLRLFLEKTKDGVTKQSALIGANNTLDLDATTLQIESNTAGDCPALPTKANCVSFGKDTAVSLLFPVWVNDKLDYRPIGTTVGYMIDILPMSKKARALETVSLKRPLTMGGYAEVTFQKSTQSAGQVLLLSADRLTWK